MSNPFTFSNNVTPDMIDHNGHVHDANYNMVFSEAINQFNYTHGLSLAERDKINYTLFTVEEQTAYLTELTKGDTYTITIYIYDNNEKSMHFFSIITSKDENNIATNAEIMIKIDNIMNKKAH